MKHRSKFHGLGFVKDLLDKKLKAEVINKKICKLYFINVKKLCPRIRKKVKKLGHLGGLVG